MSRPVRAELIWRGWVPRAAGVRSPWAQVFCLVGTAEAAEWRSVRASAGDPRAFQGDGFGETVVLLRDSLAYPQNQAHHGLEPVAGIWAGRLRRARAMGIGRSTDRPATFVEGSFITR